MIWLLAIATGLVAVAGVALPWLWPAFAQRRGLERRSANVAAYRSRLQELDRDVEANVVAADAADAVRQDLAARLLQDAEAPEGARAASGGRPAIAFVAGAGLLVFGVTWYALAGSWRTQELVELSRTAPELARATALDRMIGQLRERVADHPDDAEAWTWLGRSHRSRGDFKDAAEAFGRASALKGEQDPDLLTEHGEALALAQDRSMAGAPAARFAQALAVAPDHTQALWYSGVAALQAGDVPGAIAHWERLQRQPLPEDMRATLAQSLAQLRERSGIRDGRETAPAAAVALAIDVRVAPELASQVRPDDTVFVYAVDPAGPPMPLAAQRLPAATLPTRVTLDDGSSMVPSRKLSSVTRWRVIARVSRSGTAAPQPGDLEGSREVSGPAAGQPVPVVIDRVRP